ncbi:transporter substrate-binding domain-containing protein [Streptococcus salivarius]|uniref:transporter substrate-binding domain-containing protein n=1 Tax=Streptococcus salivarius TaxID=1304 RepID=UPI000CE2013D|nr:transporter substrate-binding domain-containing protein [Streptococcus salivarius]MEB3643758.1 transporter substrate-binding domain-containing protein [Streptococcus salivarius]PPA33093.1 amino acid ABC transporter substrate-binding protein [Streptococcus salivarius]
MRKRKYILGVLAIASLALTTVLASQPRTVEAKSNKQETITVVTGGEPRPFTFEENGKLKGHNIELVKAVFKKLPQYKLKIVRTDFKAIFPGLSSGRYQVAVNNLAKNEEREKNYLFTDPIFKNSYVVIFNKDSKIAKKAQSWSDLAGLSTVGSPGVNSTTAIEDYNKTNPDKTITLNYSAEDLKAQLEGVESGKYDFLVMDKPMFEYYQKEYKLNLVGKNVSGDLEKQLLPEPYSYFVLAKDDTKLAKEINKALKEVVKDGTSKKINEKYFDQDYSPSYDD